MLGPDRTHIAFQKKFVAHDKNKNEYNLENNLGYISNGKTVSLPPSSMRWATKGDSPYATSSIMLKVTRFWS